MRKRDTEPPVSLFPFLSVLASVMAALILALCGAVVGQVGTREAADTGGEAAAKTRTEEAAKASEGIRLSEEKKKELEKLLAEAARMASLVDKLKREADRLQKATDSTKSDTQKQTELLAELAKLRDQLEAASQLLQQLDAEIKRLRKEIEDEKAKPTKGPTIAVVPPSTGAEGRHPCFIECRREDIVLHPEGASVPMGDIDDSDKLSALCDRIKANRARDWTAILLVRPDGVRTHNQVMLLLRKRNVPHGALPIPGHQKLDLSRWLKTP